MKKEILVLVLLICIMLIGCAKAEDPRDTGSTMGDPDASVSEQNSDVLPTDGSSNAPEPTDVTEPADAADEDADLYKLPTVIGTYTDIYAEIGELEVMHYYPFAEWGSEEYKVSSSTFDWIFSKARNGIRYAIFIGKYNNACLVCENARGVILYFNGNIWDVSESGISPVRYHRGCDNFHNMFVNGKTEKLFDFSYNDCFAAEEDFMVFVGDKRPVAIIGDKAYTADDSMLFRGRSLNSYLFLVMNGSDYIWETIPLDLLGSYESIELNCEQLADDNIDASVAIGYRCIGIDFSREDSPFYVERELTIDDYIDKRFVHGSNEELAEFAVHQGVIDGISDEFAAYRDYLKEVKRRIIDRNATKISEVVEIYKEIGDLK